MADEKDDKKKAGPPVDDAKAAAAAKAARAARKKGKEDAKKAGFAANIEEGLEAKPARLKLRYRKEIVPALMKELGFKNPNEVPKLEKIVVNMGLGESISNNKVLDLAVEELQAITGQKAVVTKAKKSISNFKLREGMPIGAMVTLRKAHMWEFLDRVIAVALPRVRDFKGVSDKAFDGRGNYTLGVKEQIIFPEIEYDRVDKIRGMNISIVTTAKDDVQGKALLEALGLPMWRRGQA